MHVFQIQAASDKPGAVSLTTWGPRNFPVSVNAPGEAEVPVGVVDQFEFLEGVAQYSNLTFSVKGRERSFVVLPIAHVRDESYTSYFNVTNT